VHRARFLQEHNAQTKYNHDSESTKQKIKKISRERFAARAAQFIDAAEAAPIKTSRKGPPRGALSCTPCPKQNCCEALRR
jgi:hypothetical protein